MNLQQMLARQQAIVDACRNESRGMTGDEKNEFDSLQTQIRAMIDIQQNANGGTETDNGDSQRQELTSEQISEIETVERNRISEITAMCRDLGITENRANEFISSGTSIETTKKLIVDDLRKNHAPVSRGNELHDVKVLESDQERYTKAVSDGILIRGNVTLSETADGAKQFAGMTLKEIAIDALQRDGYKNLSRKTADEIFDIAMRSAFNPSASFPAIMDQAIQKAYVEGHKTANVTFDIFTKKGTLTDFKKHDNNYLSGPAGEFLEVPENGELKADVISDTKRPQRQLKTYGRQFTMTRQAFINDDIGFVSKVPAKYAKSARKTINKQVYQIMMSNPKIYDGNPLFHAKHGNLITTGTGITAELLKAMILALSTQLDEFGDAAIIRPAYIVVPSGYVFDMYTILYSPTINTEGNTQAVNPLFNYRDKIQVVEDPTINALSGGFGNVMPWWLIGDKDDTDFIEVDYLNGQEVPTLRRTEPAGVLGLVWDVYLDWGISVMDYRGAVKNPGITIKSSL